MNDGSHPEVDAVSGSDTPVLDLYRHALEDRGFAADSSQQRAVDRLRLW